MTKIFFDTNIYNYALDDAQVDQLRSWLDNNRLTAFASMVNLIELARTPDRGRAESLVRTLTRITRANEDPPFTKLLAEEIGESFKRHRPEWLRSSGWTETARRVAAYRQKWIDVRTSPTQAFVGLPQFDAQHQPLEQALFDQQCQVAAIEHERDVLSIEVVVPPPLRNLVGDPLADRVDGLPASERFVRLGAIEDWSSQEVRDWLNGKVTPSDDRSLAEFFLRDVEMVEVPCGALRSVVRHLQTTRRVTQGNRNDLDQANWVLRVDYVLTADKRFFELLVQARAQVALWSPKARFARIGLFKRSADTKTLSAVQNAIEGAL